jgi:hypothetical protein
VSDVPRKQLQYEPECLESVGNVPEPMLNIFCISCNKGNKTSLYDIAAFSLLSQLTNQEGSNQEANIRLIIKARIQAPYLY